MLEIAFEKEKNPSVYIISPFTTVVSGIKKYIQSYCRHNIVQKYIYSSHTLPDLCHEMRSSAVLNHLRQQVLFV